MKPIYQLAGLLLIATSLVACTTAPARENQAQTSQASNFDPSIDFGAYKNYTLFYSPVLFSTETEVPENVLAVLGQSLRDNLNGKGFNEVATRSDADFLVLYAVTVRRYLDEANLPKGFKAPAKGAWGGQYYDSTAVEVQDAGLVIKVFDIDQKRLVYSTIGGKRQELDADPNDTSDIASGVNALLADFPPKQ